jgi:hypothetical protein
MPRTEQLDSDSLLRHGITMICAGTIVCALGSLMVKPAYEQTGYLITSLVIAACLLVALLSPRLAAKQGLSRSRSIAITYIAVSSMMVCYVAVSTLQAGSRELPAVSTLAGLLGLFWAAWFMTLAFKFHPRSPQAFGLCALAAGNSSFALMLGLRIEPGKIGNVVLAGCYVIILGVQIYSAAAMLHRQLILKGAFNHS